MGYKQYNSQVTGRETDRDRDTQRERERGEQQARARDENNTFKYSNNRYKI